MAIDKAVDSAVLDAGLTSVADAIRTKGGTSEKLAFPEGFVSAVEGIPVGGGGKDSLDLLMLNTLESYSNDSVVTVPPAFKDATFLKYVSFPNATTISAEAFRNTGLTTCYIPKVTLFWANSMRQTKLTEFVHSTPARYDQSAFENSSELVKLDVYITMIGKHAFANCAVLETFILRNETIFTLPDTSCFTNTPIANGTGYIYVPAALVDDYKSATNWSTWADQIRAIEDYPEITGG